MQTLKKIFAFRLAGPFDVAHLVLALTFLSVTALPDIEAAAPVLGLSKYMPLLLKVGTYVSGALMLLKQFSPTADSVIQQAGKLSSRGFAQLRLVATLGLVTVVMAIALIVTACQGCSGVSGNQVVQDVTIGLNATICVLKTYSQDVKDGKPEALAVADASLKCGLSLTQAQSAVDGHKAAMVVEGYVLRPVDAGQ